MNGPLPSFTATNNILNSEVWNRMPEDLQKIFLEEGARSELEQLRLTAIQNEVGTEKNLRAGLELVKFNDEINAQIRVATKTHVLPGWLRRLGGPDDERALEWGPPFNERVGSWVGLKIEDDGSISEVPVIQRRGMAATNASPAQYFRHRPLRGGVYGYSVVVLPRRC